MNANFPVPEVFAANLLLIVLLVGAAVLDWRMSRIPNVLTLGGMAAGLALSLVPHGIGLLDSFLGAGTALVLALPLWLAGVTGAGDVKLLTMVGAFIGVPDIFFALLLTIVAGGALALVMGVAHGALRPLASNARSLVQLIALAALHRRRPDTRGIASVGHLPYGVCVCVGTSAWLAWRTVQF